MLRVAAKKLRGAFLLDANFELPTPGVVALFGRSGCGKTTLVNVIAGLLLADSGRVALDDGVLLDTGLGINVPPEKRRIGYVFQDARLFPHMKVEANLRYALKRAAVAPFVGVDRVVDLLDLEPLMGRRTHQLSGGERQRVAIGRALLSRWPRSTYHGARRCCHTWKPCVINWPSRWCMSATISTKCCDWQLTSCSWNQARRLRKGT
jgi:molybdate transport system ATP-binding protein